MQSKKVLSKIPNFILIHIIINNYTNAFTIEQPTIIETATAMLIIKINSKIYKLLNYNKAISDLSSSC